MKNETLERLSALRFPLIFLLVYLHYSAQENADLHAGLPAVEPIAHAYTLLSTGLSRPAIFFFVAGFLFFYAPGFSMSAYVRKLRNRVFSLLIPFVIWNGISFALHLGGQAAPPLQGFFASSPLASDDLTFWQAVDVFFGFSGFPILYPFWFIRDLIALCLLSPVFFLLARRLPWPTLVVLMVLYVANAPDLGFLGFSSIAFFYFGCLLAVRQVSPFFLDAYAAPVLVAFLACLAVIYMGDLSEPNRQLLNRIAILFSIFIVLTVTKYLIGVASIKGTLLFLGEYSFLLYAAHEPTVTILRKLKAKFLPLSEAGDIVVFLLLPVVLLLILIGVQKVLAAVSPGFLALISGGRSGGA